MITPEGRKINPVCPFNDYPTPQFRRDSFHCLNGKWEFSVEPEGEKPSYEYEILVPFAPETEASGLRLDIPKGHILHYRKKFVLPEELKHDRILLHFEAVDQVADVYLNGIHIAHHEGGYLPFTVDCLELKDGENEVVVDVTDDVDSPIYPRGKQARNPNTIWYTQTSGIWGTVWLEGVPKQVIQSIDIQPDFDHKSVEIAAKFEGKMLSSSVRVLFGNKVVGEGTFDESFKVRIPLKEFHPWTPELPSLYDVEVVINEDKVHSYFGMRKFGTIEKDGHKVFALNGEPLFLSGVLDQGYYPESGLTPPTDQAMADDISKIKGLGFNMIRKHINIEPMRWYYHADRLGIIVIQDMINGGDAYSPWLLIAAPFLRLHYDDTVKSHKLGRKTPEGKEFFEKELPLVVARRRNCVSLGIWTLFNEGWGQFDAARLTGALKELDPTRLIDSTSGWFDQGCGDFLSRHIYFRRIKLKPSPDRVLALTEFGGYSLRDPDHSYSQKNFGYAKMKNRNQFNDKMAKLYRHQIIPAKKAGLSVAVLTQFCDVERETNGLFTYDRKVMKIDEELMRELNEELIHG